MASEKLQIVVEAVDKASGVLKRTGKRIGGLSSATKLAATSVAGLGVAMGTHAVKEAMKFEKMMSDVNTLYDDQGESVAKLSKGVTDLLKRVPKDPEDLGASAYAIVSAGISDTGQALKVLEASGKLAVAGLGETAEATDILTSAINAFGLDANKAEDISNSFFLAVKSGKTTVAELSQGFGQVAPLASQLGVGFNDLLASTSAMTTSGLKASVAYTQIRATLSNMLKPTKEMQEAFGTLGITSNDLQGMLSEQGLVGTLRTLSDAVGGDQEQLAKMFGSVEALNGVMMLLGDTGTDATEILKNMEGGANALDSAFNKQTKTTEAQFKLLQNKYNMAMKDLGVKILPAVLKVMEVLSGAIDKVAVGWDKMTTALSKVFIAYDKVKASAEAAWAAVKRAPGNIGAGIKSLVGKITGRATGGIVRPGETTLVGENGPELAQFPPGTRIVPNMAGAGGNITINISGNQFLSEDASERFGDDLVRILKRNIRI